MFIRQVYLADQRVLGDAETLQLEINTPKPVTAVDLKLQATTGSGAVAATPLPRQIANISILDGALALMSAIGHVMFSNAMFAGSGIHLLNDQDAATTVNEFYVRILFGRFYGDKEYFLDPKRYNNLILSITNALTITATDYATGTGRISVLAHIIEDGVGTYKGVRMLREVARPTLAAAAEDNTELPVDYPYQGIQLHLTDGTVDPDAVLARARLDLDSDSLVLQDSRMVDLMAHNIEVYGEQIIHPDQLLDMAVAGGLGVAPGTAFLRYFHVFGGIYIPLMHGQPAELMDVSRNKSFRLRLTGGGTGGAVRIVVNQMYTK